MTAAPFPAASDEASARLQADVDLIGRAGARELEVGYLDDDVPADEARSVAEEGEGDDQA